jgi:hypothetical protein
MLSQAHPFAAVPVAALATLSLACGATSIIKEPEQGQMHDAGVDAGPPVPPGCEQSVPMHPPLGDAPPADANCDMTGLWALRMTSWAHGLADTEGANWYYLQIEQHGEEFEVVDHFDCGIYVDAAGLNVQSSQKLESALYKHNLQKGRRGTMKRVGNACNLRFDRFWSLRGASDEIYLPCGHHDLRDIADLQKQVPLPSKANPKGAEDWDEDGRPGITMLIASNDARWSVQRDWLEWFSCNENELEQTRCADADPATHGIKAAKSWPMLNVRADFNNEDSVIGATNPLYETPGIPTRTGKDNHVQFLLLGRSRDEGAAKAFWALPDTEARCAHIRELLPAEKD